MRKRIFCRSVELSFVFDKHSDNWYRQYQFLFEYISSTHLFNSHFGALVVYCLVIAIVDFPSRNKVFVVIFQVLLSLFKSNKDHVYKHTCKFNFFWWNIYSLLSVVWRLPQYERNWNYALLSHFQSLYFTKWNKDIENWTNEIGSHCFIEQLVIEHATMRCWWRI